jgi:hypothetical protein
MNDLPRHCFAIYLSRRCVAVRRRRHRIDAGWSVKAPGRAASLTFQLG